MWEYILIFLKWLNQYSGLIQVMLGGFAIILAYLGYKKVLEQILISHKQTDISLRQEELNLKLNIMNLTTQNIELIGKMLIQVPLVKKELELIQQKLLAANDSDAAIIEKNINSLQEQESILEENRKQLAELAKNFFEGKINSNMSDEYLNTLTTLLIKSNNHLIVYNTLIYNIDEVKKEKNII